ncbi:hypothetical protein CSUB01_07058 [Colletotrichum sublineola]|uniref:Uncharacterized protein n=1 Tax=Colletotrichum sublineola TaxID=1173701 RepID=A0A066XP50_COLSU|nr:hypothetical protein CSUB01_07058 [Colletotrichum sublineola]
MSPFRQNPSMFTSSRCLSPIAELGYRSHQHEDVERIIIYRSRFGSFHIHWDHSPLSSKPSTEYPATPKSSSGPSVSSRYDVGCVSFDYGSFFLPIVWPSSSRPKPGTEYIRSSDIVVLRAVAPPPHPSLPLAKHVTPGIPNPVYVVVQKAIDLQPGQLLHGVMSSIDPQLINGAYVDIGRAIVMWCVVGVEEMAMR